MIMSSSPSHPHTISFKRQGSTGTNITNDTKGMVDMGKSRSIQKSSNVQSPTSPIFSPKKRVSFSLPQDSIELQQASTSFLPNIPVDTPYHSQVSLARERSVHGSTHNSLMSLRLPQIESDSSGLPHGSRPTANPISQASRAYKFDKAATFFTSPAAELEAASQIDEGICSFSDSSDSNLLGADDKVPTAEKYSPAVKARFQKIKDLKSEYLKKIYEEDVSKMHQSMRFAKLGNEARDSRRSSLQRESVGILEEREGGRIRTASLPLVLAQDSSSLEAAYHSSMAISRASLPIAYSARLSLTPIIAVQESVSSSSSFSPSSGRPVFQNHFNRKDRKDSFEEKMDYARRYRNREPYGSSSSPTQHVRVCSN